MKAAPVKALVVCPDGKEKLSEPSGLGLSTMRFSDSSNKIAVP